MSEHILSQDEISALLDNLPEEEEKREKAPAAPEEAPETPEASTPLAIQGFPILKAQNLPEDIRAEILRLAEGTRSAH